MSISCVLYALHIITNMKYKSQSKYNAYNVMHKHACMQNNAQKTLKRILCRVKNKYDVQKVTKYNYLSQLRRNLAIFFQYEHIPGHQCFWSLMSLANILFQVICVNLLYEPRDFSNLTNTKTIIDPDYFFSSRLFLQKTPKHQITRKNVITRRSSNEIS